MKIDRVEVIFKALKNTGNYENVEASVKYSASILSNESPQEVTEKLELIAKSEVKRILLNKRGIKTEPKTFEELF